MLNKHKTISSTQYPHLSIVGYNFNHMFCRLIRIGSILKQMKIFSKKNYELFSNDFLFILII